MKRYAVTFVFQTENEEFEDPNVWIHDTLNQVLDSGENIIDFICEEIEPSEPIRHPLDFRT